MQSIYDLQSAYKLFDPGTDETRYVGISNDPYRRYGQHLADRTKCEKVEWIHDLQNDGLLPGMQIIETDMMPVIAGEREKYWVTTPHALRAGASRISLTERTRWRQFHEGSVQALGTECLLRRYGHDQVPCHKTHTYVSGHSSPCAVL